MAYMEPAFNPQLLLARAAPPPPSPPFGQTPSAACFCKPCDVAPAFIPPLRLYLGHFVRLAEAEEEERRL